MEGQSKSLYYIPILNKFADSQWVIIHDLHRYFDAWQLDHWKRAEKNDTLMSKAGTLWHLYYLSEDEEDDMLEAIDWNAGFGIKMDRRCYD